MRKIFMLLFGAFPFLLLGQGDVSNTYEVADQMPYFPGCSEFDGDESAKRDCSNRNLIIYISDYLHYPEKARALGIEGTVYLKFVVEENGEVKHTEVVRNIGGGCGEVALQIVENMPDWEPGKMRGKSVPVALTLPIKFSLKNAGKTKVGEARIAWGDLYSPELSKERLLENLEKEIIVRDLTGKPLGITQLTFAHKKGEKIKEVESRGTITPKMKKFVKKLKKKGEFAVIATVQIDGEFVDVERVFRILN